MFLSENQLKIMLYKPYFFRSFLVAMLSTASLVAALTACKKDTEATPGPDIQVNPTSLGNVITDQNGRTLYFFAPDVTGKSACSGQCLDTWPIFYKETPTLSTSLAAADFTTITRADGSKQTAFQGWPLYYYKSDTKAGDVLGENVNKVWYVAKPDYTVMIASAQLVGNDGKSYTKDYKEGTGSTLYFTDAGGKTLYAFANDKKGTNNYTKADFSNNATWPIWEGSAIKSIPSILKASDFATTTAAGRTQLTYKGWPLYYFGPDAGQRGVTKGVSVPRPGVWPIVYVDSPDAP
ncbi:secreted repeat of unknown function [Fibrella aestuarina BUZ 2]|uniref:Lipoprotein n=1 Tax=Fibrella aestuarina BUZ 2 TaxID=1166018 RepID=I0K3G5_9BACT|nr:secreted repeat of unknown function [Fibrella aestuarina]CCG98668.1 secreted repeat of unknown function [Fibrella aestuarina BUZ 2]